MMIKNRLRHILLDKDMSINELAEATQTAYKTIYNFATGRTQSAHYGLLDRICEALQVQPGDILVWEPGNGEGE